MTPKRVKIKFSQEAANKPYWKYALRVKQSSKPNFVQ